jgi:hypothetical protein
MATIHKFFEGDSEEVQREWVRFTQKIDKRMEDALRHTVKKSLQVRQAAVSALPALSLVGCQSLVGCTVPTGYPVERSLCRTRFNGGAAGRSSLTTCCPALGHGKAARWIGRCLAA